MTCHWPQSHNFAWNTRNNAKGRQRGCGCPPEGPGRPRSSKVTWIGCRELLPHLSCPGEAPLLRYTTSMTSSTSTATLQDSTDMSPSPPESPCLSGLSSLPFPIKKAMLRRKRSLASTSLHKTVIYCVKQCKTYLGMWSTSTSSI